MQPSTIGGINKLPENEKRAIYARYIPQELIQKFKRIFPIPFYMHISQTHSME
jgi:hypothetical protein